MSSSKASVDLPSPSISWEAALAYFELRGLDVLDLATLLGTIDHCIIFFLIDLDLIQLP